MLMQKALAVVCVLAFFGLLNSTEVEARQEARAASPFQRYKAVEGYEIRPGVLMMPRYAPDGQVCEIGLQRRIYSPEVVRIDAELERKQIDDLVDELVPAKERGPRTSGLLGRGLITVEGTAMDQLDDYENVSIEVYSKVASSSKRKMIVECNLAAVIRWKHRECR